MKNAFRSLFKWNTPKAESVEEKKNIKYSDKPVEEQELIVEGERVEIDKQIAFGGASVVFSGKFRGDPVAIKVI